MPVELPTDRLPPTFFSAYLALHTDAPNLPDFRLPKSDLGLLHLAGYDQPVSRVVGWNPDSRHLIHDTKSQQPSYYRWAPFVRHFPQLREWLASPEAFVAPDRWPAPVAEVMPEHVTPLAFELGLMPQDKHLFRGAIITNAFRNSPYGFGALSAWAKGFPVNPRDWGLMADAAQKLQTLIPFQLWAYPLNLDGVALPDLDTPTRGMFDVYRMRAILVKDPLSATPLTIQWGLPKWAHDFDNLVHLPRLPFDPTRTTRRARLAGLNGPRHSHWLCWTPSEGHRTLPHPYR